MNNLAIPEMQKDEFMSDFMLLISTLIDKYNSMSSKGRCFKEDYEVMKKANYEDYER